MGQWKFENGWGAWRIGGCRGGSSLEASSARDLHPYHLKRQALPPPNVRPKISSEVRNSFCVFRASNVPFQSHERGGVFPPAGRRLFRPSWSGGSIQLVADYASGRTGVPSLFVEADFSSPGCLCRWLPVGFQTQFHRLCNQVGIRERSLLSTESSV